jgi:hypothetical protein
MLVALYENEKSKTGKYKRLTWYKIFSSILTDYPKNSLEVTTNAPQA